MTDTMLPIIRQLRDARDDRVRADLLLRISDTILLKYADVIADACASFGDGVAFLDLRVAALRATRDAAGLLPERQARPLDALRAAMARYAAGGDDAAPAEWPIDAPQGPPSLDI